MAPVLAFPYEPASLHWAPDKKSNAEGIYCYCGKNKRSDEPMLRCDTCQNLFHSGCVSCLSKPLLKGDEFFHFQCSVCRKGPELFERQALSWVILVHLVLYNLMDASPQQKYFRWKEEICKFIDDYWSYLLPEKERMEIKGASGWWTLIEKAPPDKNKKLKPKNKNIPKSGVPRPPGARKDKRQRAKGSPRKKTRFDETSSDDDFHTTAKPRLSSIPTTRIKSRQISFSSGSSLSSAGELSDDSLDGEFWRSDDEEEIRPTVLLHGIPALIHHHFNPNQLDFSSGPIDYEHFFRLADLVDDDTSSRVIQKVRKALNSVGGVLALSGKKKRRTSSIAEIKHEDVEQILHRDHYVEEMSDLTPDEDEDEDDEDEDEDEDGSGSGSESSTESGSDTSDDDDDDDESDEEDASDEDDEDNRRHLASLKSKAIAAKTAAGKRYNQSSQRKTSTGRRPSLLPPSSLLSPPPTTGGKMGGKGGRKSSLKPGGESAAERASMAATAPTKTKKVTLSFSSSGGAGHEKSAHWKQKSGTGTTLLAGPGAKASKTKSKSANGRRASTTSTSASQPSQPPPPSSSSQSTTVLPPVPAPAPAPPPPPAVPSQVEIQRQQEWHILQLLEDAPKPLPTVAARFKRKLRLKRLKAFLHLPLFDLERYMRVHLQSPLDLVPMSKEIPPDPHELQQRRQRAFEQRVKAIDHTPYGSSFASRLYGRPTNCLSRRPWELSDQEGYERELLDGDEVEDGEESEAKGHEGETLDQQQQQRRRRRRRHHPQSQAAPTLSHLALPLPPLLPPPAQGKISPFTGKLLKDFIWRDYESRALMMDLLDEIRARNGRPAKMPWSNLGTGAMYGRATKKRKRGAEHGQTIPPAAAPSPALPVQSPQQKGVVGVAPSEQGASPSLSTAADTTTAAAAAAQFSWNTLAQPIERAPIDYCYLRKEHLSQVNETLCRRFWPGIDMTDALQYPDYSVVVLYKRLVIGCAFMTPEGYITYVAVSAGWEKAGIGQFMLYHLMQAAEGRDITLHVSANNPAMIMYQKFGFKPEQFLIDFYKEYLPDDSTMCHNAFFVRLRR
ncbi:Cysteine-rich protein 2-binding protein [Actinomortierella ambigua]|nr:Cysteine-rich protein 2-binding protein [Actinomortierella ambigua]